MTSDTATAEKNSVSRLGTGERFEIPVDYLPHGSALLHDPLLNKGTAFTDTERELLGLRGLLPPRVFSEEAQVDRALEILEQKSSDLERYIYLIALQDRNETLFYRVLAERLPQLMPIIYTPVVGLACERYGHLFRRPRGLWISANDRGRISSILQNWPHDNVRIVVVTDGERILGLGDLGADGMGIPVGKLTLYTACAGISPIHCLPVTLDVGTNNTSLLEDPLYIGLPQKRLRGEAYDALIAEFLEAIHQRFPKAIIQFEDFANANAFRLLEQYRGQYSLFDDDIQGTGCVILAGLLAAQRLHKIPLKDQRFLFFGAGEAVLGISGLIVNALVDTGMSEAEARTHCWLFDSHGLVVRDRIHVSETKKTFAHVHECIDTFEDAVRILHPTGIIGASGQPGAFTQSVVRQMAKLNRHPVIMALSNPTSKSECTAEQAYTWSSGRAIFASGSPFDPVIVDGQQLVPGQGNNAYVFPGIGLGAIACGAGQLPDQMFFAAAKALAAEVTDEDLKVGRIFPSLERIREVSVKVAEAVCRVAYEQGLATEPEPGYLKAHLRSLMFVPDYKQYI